MQSSDARAWMVAAMAAVNEVLISQTTRYTAGPRALARGLRPGRSRYGYVCRSRAMPGAWGGDGSVSVVTRQRLRKAARVEAKGLHREVVLGRRAGIEEMAFERERARVEGMMETPRGAIEAAWERGVV